MKTEKNEQDDLMVVGNETVTVIDDRKPVPAGTYVAAIRLIALLGSGDHFASEAPRSAWMWVVRLPDGSHSTLTFLVNHNRLPIHEYAAALAGDDSLLNRVSHCDANRIIGRSAMIEVLRQAGGNGRDRPYVNRAWALPLGVEPIRLADASVWQPTSRKPIPQYAPQWVRTYAEGAVALLWMGRKKGEEL